MPKVVKTICQMCYFYCGLEVTVEDGRILKVEGMREHPANHGRLCAKGIACAQLVTDSNRLRTPLRRVGKRGGGEWRRVSWKDALQEIGEKWLAIREKHGAEQVGYYRGHAPGWVTNYNYVLRLMAAWGSPNIFTHAQLCFTPRAIAHAATFGGFPEPDYEHANCIALFGYNPVYTSPVNYAPRILWARERGAKLIVVDPRFTNTAAKADLFLQPRPGTTGALALALVQCIIENGWYDPEFIQQWTLGFEPLKEFVQDYTPEKAEEITGVRAHKVREAARLLGTVKPVVIVDGNGLDQHTNTVQTVRTTSILRSLLRTVDEPGGSIFVPPLPFVDVQMRGARTAESGAEPVLEYPLYYAASGSLTGVELTDALLHSQPYPLRALMVQGGDPLAVLSDTAAVRLALDKLDLLVVHDLYPTATTQMADLVLPAASFLERDLILYYRYRPFADGNLIALQQQCVPPVGESLSDLDLNLALARALELGEAFPWKTGIEAFDWELKPNGITVEWLRQHPEGFVRKYSPEELYRKYERTGFGTPSKKIEFVASRFAGQGYDPLPTFVEPLESPVSAPDLAKEYPLIGSTGLKLGIHTHTQFRTLPWIREIEPDPFVEVNPKTAKELGIEDGEWVAVETPKGSARARARVRATVQPRVVMLTHGYGQPYAGQFDLPNRITSEKGRDPIAGCTSNRSFLCRLVKLEG